MSTDWLNLGIVPRSGLEYWHALDDIDPNTNALPENIPDYSGNGRHLGWVGATGSIFAGEIPANLRESRNALYFDGGSPASYENDSAVLLIKNIFILAKYDGAAFAGNEGLLSDTNAINVLTGGGAAQTKFFDFSFPGYLYFINNQPKVANNQQAPMNDWGLIEIQSTPGLPLEGLRLGRQLGGSETPWKGFWAEHLVYSRILSETEKLRVLLYFNLKYGAHRFTSGVGALNYLYFPSDDFLDFRRSRFYAYPPAYDLMTDSFEFEDGGRTFNESSSSPILRWEYEYLGRDPNQAAIFDAFYDQARLVNPFYFLDKYGTLHENVRIESYSRAHEAHRSWRNDCRFVLVKYP